MDRVASDKAVAEAAAAPTMTSPAASHGGGGSSDGTVTTAVGIHAIEAVAAYLHQQCQWQPGQVSGRR